MQKVSALLGTMEENTTSGGHMKFVVEVDPDPAQADSAQDLGARRGSAHTIAGTWPREYANA